MHDGPQLLSLPLWPLSKQTTCRMRIKSLTHRHNTGWRVCVCGYYNAVCESWPAEVDAGVVVVLCGGVGGVAVRESAEKCVGEQAGYLNLWQRDACVLSSLQQRDGLKTRTHAPSPSSPAWRSCRIAASRWFSYLFDIIRQPQGQLGDLWKQRGEVVFFFRDALQRNMIYWSCISVTIE